MVKSYIIYGYSITIDDISSIFSQEKYPDFYEDGKLIKDEIELMCHTYKAFKLLIQSFKRIHKTDIFLYQTDFEFTTTEMFPDIDGNVFSIYDKGQTTIVLGLQLGFMDSYYAGFMRVPEVNDAAKAILAMFIKSAELDLSFMNPSAMFIADSEK